MERRYRKRTIYNDGSTMFRVLTCLTSEHDQRLVALAVLVCLLASGVAISLFHRAQATRGRARLIWLSLDAAAGGCGIWATHFIAMLAHEPDTGAAYDRSLTILSLVIAAVITGVGLSVALRDRSPRTAAVGGTVIGFGIGAMHYVGMLAVELPGRITWSPGFVVASLALG